MDLFDNEIFKQLLSLNLPSNNYAIFGSGPMFAHRIRPIEDLRDIDLIARGKAWELAKQKGNLTTSKRGWPVVLLFDGKVEVFKGWGSPQREWEIDKLIDEADEIEGVRFVRLSEVLKWKKEMNRPKDAAHIKMIEGYLNNS